MPSSNRRGSRAVFAEAALLSPTGMSVIRLGGTRGRWLFAAVVFASILPVASPSHAAGVFVRFRVVEPAGPGKFSISAGGFRHSDPWYLPSAKAEADAGQWSEWLDVSGWPWHRRM